MQPGYYPPAVPNQDEEHLRQLSVAHYIYAGLQCFMVFFGLTFFGFGLAMIARPDWFKGAEPPPLLLSGVFMGLGLFFSLMTIGFAYCTYLAGRSIKERRRHTFCMIVAAFNCLSMPLGTILGVLTLIVLQRPTVKPLFRP